MDTHNKGVFALSIVTVLLAGCGGGGGGSSSATLGGFAGISHPSTTTLSAQTQQVSRTGLITIIAVGSPTAAQGATYTETTDATGATTELIVTTPTSSVYLSDPDSTVLILDPIPNGYNYQTYGIWEAVNFDTAQGSIGVLSTGWATPGNAIPTSGTANYVGDLAGYLLTETGGMFSTVTKSSFEASVTIGADFGAHSLNFSSTGSEAALNMAGTMTYAAGSNSFNGTLTTNSGLSGTASGKFYGPAAEELGGTVAMQSGGTTLLGAFGAKR